MSMFENSPLEKQGFARPIHGQTELSQTVQDFFRPLDHASKAGNADAVLDFGTGAALYQSVAYTGEIVSARVFMVDEVEQKTDATKIQGPTDALSRPSVIRTKEDAALWDAMQSKSNAESATHIGLSDEVIAQMKSKGQASKLELFDSAAEGAMKALQQPKKQEQVLIASNIVPGVPGLEQKQYQSVQNDFEQPIVPKVAQSLDGYMAPPTLVPSPEQLGITPETVKALTKIATEMILPWTKEFPQSERENALMDKTLGGNPNAWDDARKAFPQLEHVPAAVMQAYTRNEIANYNRFDMKDDMDAATGVLQSVPGRPAEQATLGLSQISPKGIREFEQKYPQFKQFLESKGYTGRGHEIAALLDPECAPMIVAAKTASIVEDMQKHGIKSPTAAQIAYAYNPDVFSFSDGEGGRTFKALYHPDIELSKVMHPDQQKEFYAKDPRVAQASTHVRNVMKYLR